MLSSDKNYPEKIYELLDECNELIEKYDQRDVTKESDIDRLNDMGIFEFHHVTEEGVSMIPCRWVKNVLEGHGLTASIVIDKHGNERCSNCGYAFGVRFRNMRRRCLICGREVIE